MGRFVARTLAVLVIGGMLVCLSHAAQKRSITTMEPMAPHISYVLKAHNSETCKRSPNAYANVALVSVELMELGKDERDLEGNVDLIMVTYVIDVKGVVDRQLWAGIATFDLRVRYKDPETRRDVVQRFPASGTGTFRQSETRQGSQAIKIPHQSSAMIVHHDDFVELAYPVITVDNIQCF
jgi:hypothetical protein